MKLTLVPAGDFMMGAEENPSDTLAAFPYARREWLDGETPQHRVKITKPIHMGVEDRDEPSGSLHFMERRDSVLQMA